MSQFYPSNYGNPRQSRRVVMQRLKSAKHRRLLASIRRFNPGVRSLLDYGCGDAHFVRDVVSCGLNAYGTDFDDRRQSNVEAVGATWIDLDKIMDGEHVFDAIVLLQVFEHLANPDQLLSRLGKVLAPGAVVVIETPCTSGPDAQIFDISLWGGLHSPRHYFIPSFVGLEDYLRRFNFQMLDHVHIPSPYTWAETFRARFSTGKTEHLANRFFSIDNPFFLFLISIFEYTRLFLGKETSNQRVILRKVVP